MCESHATATQKQKPIRLHLWLTENWKCLVEWFLPPTQSDIYIKRHMFARDLWTSRPSNDRSRQLGILTTNKLPNYSIPSLHSLPPMMVIGHGYMRSKTFIFFFRHLLSFMNHHPWHIDVFVVMNVKYRVTLKSYANDLKRKLR